MAVEILDEHYFALCAIVTVVMQLAFFAVAYTFKFDKVTDFAGSMNFVVLAILTLVLGGYYYTRQIVSTAIVLVTRLELAALLLTRVLKRGHDVRFDEMRESFFAFLGFWVFQMFWVFGTCLSIIFINSEPVDVPLGASDYIGWAISVFGFAIQMWADLVKMKFRGDKANRGKFCKAGPWRWSRHPNYLGEILLWWGIFIAGTRVFAASASPVLGYLTALSALWTMALLMGISGIPMSEVNTAKRYGGEEYSAYHESTSPLFLVPPALYRPLPLLLKRVLCCQYPCYDIPATADKSEPIAAAASHNGAGTEPTDSGTRATGSTV